MLGKIWLLNPNLILSNYQLIVSNFYSEFNLKFEFKYCFISVAGAVVSAAGAAVSVAAGLLFVLLSYFFSCWSRFSVASASFRTPSESPSTIAAVTKDKILSIDLEASSFDGITSRGSELVSIAKLECLILSFFYCDVFSFDIYYK
jgi:hypothetical protein